MNTKVILALLMTLSFSGMVKAGDEIPGNAHRNEDGYVVGDGSSFLLKKTAILKRAPYGENWFEKTVVAGEVSCTLGTVVDTSEDQIAIGDTPAGKKTEGSARVEIKATPRTEFEHANNPSGLFLLDSLGQPYRIICTVDGVQKHVTFDMFEVLANSVKKATFNSIQIGQRSYYFR